MPIRHWRRLKWPLCTVSLEAPYKGHVYKHIVREHCAQQLFIQIQKNVCPHRKHHFSDTYLHDIEGALQRDVVNDAVQRSQPPIRRLFCFECVGPSAEEHPLGPSIARALLWSLVDSRQHIIVAAARAIANFAVELRSLQ